ncbi:MAG: protein kinase [Phycisphaerales bacterium]
MTLRDISGPEEHSDDALEDHDFEQAKQAFIEASKLGTKERDAFLLSRFADAPYLRERVLRLLAFSDRSLPYETLADDLLVAHARALDIAYNDEDDQRGAWIGPYQIIDRLGEGGFGVVYRARQTEPVKREVALKVIKLGMDTQQVVARFRAEQQALAIMDHPSIAKVFDAGATISGRPYFVMEIIDGEPITRYCDRKHLTIRERLTLFRQVCAGVHHAHQKGVIHRDLKPSNILVAEADGQPIPRIIDFGIAKATNTQSAEHTAFTELKQMIGTPGYMSPEQADLSATGVDSRSDVYALGAILYELLTGSTPFGSDRLRSVPNAEMLRIIRDETPLRPSVKLAENGSATQAAMRRSAEPSRLRSLLASELDWVVMRCLRTCPDERYGSAAELERDIGRYLLGSPVEAVPPRRVYRARKFYRNHRAAVVLVAALTLSFFVGFAGTVVGFINASEQQQIAEKESLEARRQTYVAQMQLAWSSLGDRPGRAQAFLETAPTDQRGWEWFTLFSRLDESSRVLRAPLPVFTGTYNDYEAVKVVLNPDGDTLLTLLQTGPQRVLARSLTTGSLLFSVPPIDDDPGSFERKTFHTVSPDGTELFQFDAFKMPWGNARRNFELNEMRVQRFDARSGALLGEHRVTLPGEGASMLDASGRFVVHYEKAAEVLRLIDAESGAMLASQSELDYPVVDLYFSPIGDRVVAIGQRGECTVLATSDLSEVHRLVGHTNYIVGVEFTPDGSSLITASLDQTARVWSLGADLPQPLVLEHDASVHSVGLSKDGAVAMTETGTIQAWDVATGERIARYAPESLMKSSSFITPDGDQIGSRDLNGDIRLWSVEARKTVNLKGHQGLVNFAKFTGPTGYVLSGGWDGWKANAVGSVRIWDAETGIEVATLGRPGDIAIDADVSEDGRLAVVGMLDGPSIGFNIIDLVSGRRSRIPGKPNGGIAIHPARPVAAVVRNFELSLIDLRSEEIEVETDHYVWDGLGGMVWNSSGSHLAVAVPPRASPTANQQIAIYKDGSLEHFAWIDGSSVSRDPVTGGFLIFDAVRGVVVTYDPQSSGVVSESPLPGVGSGLVKIRSNGSRLAATSPGEGAVMLWDAESLSRVAVFDDDGYVSDIGWSQDGSRLIVTSDSTIQIWDQTPLGVRARLRKELDSVLCESWDVLDYLGQAQTSELARKRATEIQYLQRGLLNPL